jgi:RNA polymerase sigma-70 factor (family 1)
MADESTIRQEEERRFRLLFDTYLTRVHDYISALSRSDYIAEEVTQELFLILWRKRSDLSHVQNIDQYIFRIARNLAINLLKRAALDSKTATLLYKNSMRMTNEVAENVSQRGVQYLIDKAIMTLPAQPRRIYLLSRRENLNYDEMAEATGLSRNTVKNHLQKALHDIREYLILHGYQPVLAALILKFFE